MSAAVLAAALAVGTVGATAAEAKPAPGPTGLAATVTAHPDGSYLVAASWNATPSATSYRVALTKGGTTLSSATVTTTSWSPTVTTTPGSASLSVRAVVARKPGKTATISVSLPDLTAPSGAFHATWENNTGVAKIAVATPVADNSGGSVTATVDWNDGSLPQSWALTSDITHTYPLTAARYVPVVTLTDSSNNHNSVEVNAVVINDDQVPTGSFTNENATAWAGYTKVTVSQNALADNWSPADHITRTVDWGDGTTSDWTGADPIAHVYTVADTYTPAVTLTDEADNHSLPIDTSAVVVSADTVSPTVKIATATPKHSVKAWKTLRGTATDTAGTGVKTVWVKAVEKRGAAWFGYNAATHTWLKAATKAKAFAKSKAFTRTTDASHRWSAKLVGLKKGTLVAKARATDQVGNRSVTVTRKASLTAR